MQYFHCGTVTFTHNPFGQVLVKYTYFTFPLLQLFTVITALGFPECSPPLPRLALHNPSTHSAVPAFPTAAVCVPELPGTLRAWCGLRSWRPRSASLC